MPASPSDSSSRITRRGFLLGAGAVAGTGIGLYSSIVARHEIDVVQRDIAIRHLPEPFAGYRIAQISDIHFDQYTEPSFVGRVVNEVNSLAPDLVVLTGDFISRGPMPIRFGEREIGHCAQVLSGLSCPLRYGILGNHDAGVNSGVVVDTLKSHGIPMLIDSHVPIERDGKRFWLCGVHDISVEEPRLDHAVPKQPDGPVILLAHEPDYVDTVLRQREARFIDLVLSGHSHGGQVRIPGIRPLILPPLGKKYVAGHFQFGPMQLYVNRGIGTVGLPFRLNCPPEITIFTLRPA